MSKAIWDNGKFDASGMMGDLFRPREGERPEWPMYSYSRPAYMVWNTIGQYLLDDGWTEDEIKEWLQSKSPRHCLDGSLGSAIKAAVHEWAVKELE